MRRRSRHQKGREAREQAERDLAETEARWPEVHEVANNMRELRCRNQFAEQLTLAMTRGRP